MIVIRNKVKKNTIGSLAWLIPSIPFLTLLIWILYAALMYFEIGHMPIVYDDIIQEKLRFVDGIAGVFLVILVLSFPIVLVFMLLLLKKPFVAIVSKQIASYFVLLSIVIVFFIFTPLGGFIEWYLD